MQYGKSLDWKNESYTTHDVASVFRRYLTQMPVRRFAVDIYFLLIFRQGARDSARPISRRKLGICASTAMYITKVLSACSSFGMR